MGSQQIPQIQAPDGYGDDIYFGIRTKELRSVIPNGGYWEIYTTSNGGAHGPEFRAIEYSRKFKW